MLGFKKRALKYQATQTGLISSWFSWKVAEFVADKELEKAENIAKDAIDAKNENTPKSKKKQMKDNINIL